ncbi:MAG: hypothetical protein V7643_787 [Mycobacterium sp.]|jgi:hypothetical protein
MRCEEFFTDIKGRKAFRVTQARNPRASIARPSPRAACHPNATVAARFVHKSVHKIHADVGQIRINRVKVVSYPARFLTLLNTMSTDYALGRRSRKRVSQAMLNSLILR